MPIIGSNAENRKLIAQGTQADDFIAQAALSSLDREGKRRTAIDVEPRFTLRRLRDHLQSASVQDDVAFLTSSVSNGLIYVAEKQQDGRFKAKQHATPTTHNHPGGIQMIGDFIAVPEYTDSEGASVHFYDSRRDPLEPDTTTRVEFNGKRAYCLGIANVSEGDKEIYVMAVVTAGDGDDVAFFRSARGDEDKPIGECQFEEIGTWTHDEADLSEGIDDNWGGYGNTIALIATEDHKLYFLGAHIHNPSILDHLMRPAWGEDWVDLFRVDFSQPKEKWIKKVGNKHVKCVGGASFRYGGSARVSASDRIEITATVRNVSLFRRRVLMNLFTA